MSNLNFLQPAHSTTDASIVDPGRVFKQLRQHTGLLKTAAVGLVVAIGSFGLLLGAVTVALSSILVAAGFDLLIAMTLGFFITGISGTAVGLVLAIKAIRFLIRELPSDFSPS